MSSNKVENPYPIFTDTNGRQLENGYIYIGQPGLDAEFNQVSIYSDPELTIPVSQPVRTSGGYPVVNGAVFRFYVDGNHSIKVKNKNGELVYSANNSNSLSGSASTNFATLADAKAATYLIDGCTVKTDGYYSQGDGGSNEFYYDSSSSATVNDGSIVALNTMTGRLIQKDATRIHLKQFGAKGDGITNDTVRVQAAIDSLVQNGILDLSGLEYLASGLAINTAGVTIKNGKIKAPLSATESCFVVTANNVEFNRVDTFVDWANLTASGTVNVGGIHAANVTGLRVIGGTYEGARSDDYGNVIANYRCVINLYRCQDCYIAPTKVGECGYIDALGLWESYSCEIDGGLYENGQYSGVATATDEGVAPAGTYGHHIIRGVTVRGMGTSSITINDVRGQVIAPVVDGGLNGVNFGHSSGQPGQIGIVADNSTIIGGIIKNATAHGVGVGNSKNIRVIGTYIEDPAGSGVRFFDNCDGGYVGAGTKIRRCGETFIGFSIGAYAGSYTVDGVDAEFCGSHGIYCIGGSEYKIKNVKMKDVDNSNAGRNVIQWEAASQAADRFECSGVDYEHVNSASPANRGINIDDPVASTTVDIHDNNLADVDFEKIRFGNVTPTSLNIYKNRLSSDPMTGFVAFAGGSTSQVVSNGNITAYVIPKITYRDADCHTRQIYVSTYTNGSFTIAGGTGGNADFVYEV
jgi:hypothetical protein